MTRPPALPLARVRSRWSDAESESWARSTPDPDLGERIYTSRLLGAEPSLVLCGGGNTSVKSTLPDLFGKRRPVLWVKGSGADLAHVTAADFAPVDLAAARRLLELPALSDSAMLRELRLARLDPDAPTPSCEALLHAFLPARFIDHTHADSALAVLDSRYGKRLAEEIWGADHLIVPYVKPGFDLARMVRSLWLAAGDAAARWSGMVLLNHGIFTFGATARESYERMLSSVERGRAASAGRRSSRTASDPLPPARPAKRGSAWSTLDVAALRCEVSMLAGRPLIARLDSSAGTRAAIADARFRRAAGARPAHPRPRAAHQAVAALSDRPESLGAGSGAATDTTTPPTSPPRGRPAADSASTSRRAWRCLPGGGVVGFGDTARAAAAALAISRHTLAAAQAAQSLGGYRPLPDAELFEVEYWELEQAKLETRIRASACTRRPRGAGQRRGARHRARLHRGAATTGRRRRPASIASRSDSRARISWRCAATRPTKRPFAALSSAPSSASAGSMPWC